MRASDEDRQRTVDELRRHCAAGRIDVDEYAARLERALSATTLEQLDELRSDLPMLRIAEPAGGGVWAARNDRGRSGRLLPVDHVRDRPGAGDDPAGRGRMVAVGIAALTVAVVLTAIVLSLVAEWTWAVVLVVGWVAGLAQGRLGRRRA